MQARDANSMGLDVDNLRDIDEAILDYLQEGRVTPAYCRDRLLDEDAIEVTSTYCGQRLQRLEEHDHVQNLYNTGLYELVNDPRRPDTVRAGGDAGGRMSEGDLFEDGSQAIDGHTAIELTDPDRDDAPNLAEELQEDVLSGLQYNAGMWGDDTFFVQDKEHEEVFELALEPPNIILYARENTTALSLRSFCQEILDEFDSTYSLEKKQNMLVGQ